MEKEKLSEMSKEELIELCEKQKKEINFANSVTDMYQEESRKLKAKIETIEKILQL